MLLFIIIACNKVEVQKNDESKFKISQVMTPAETGDFHTKITEIAYVKIQDWKGQGLSRRQILTNLYHKVFIDEFSLLTGLDRQDIIEFLDANFGLNENTVATFDIHRHKIDDVGMQKLYEDIRSVTDKNPSRSRYEEEIERVRERYENVISSKRLNTVLAITESSYFYWEENFNAWVGDESILRNEDPEKKKETKEMRGKSKECKNTVVGGDVRGAIKGVIATIWSGLGVVPAAVTGAMAGTLLGAVEVSINGVCK